MEFRNYQRSQAPQGRSLVSGRGFAVADPERQREIDLDCARALAKRCEPSMALNGGRASPCGWIPAQRDPADEGGSGRRGTR